MARQPSNKNARQSSTPQPVKAGAKHSEEDIRRMVYNGAYLFPNNSGRVTAHDVTSLGIREPMPNYPQPAPVLDPQQLRAAVAATNPALPLSVDRSPLPVNPFVAIPPEPLSGEFRAGDVAGQLNRVTMWLRSVGVEANVEHTCISVPDTASGFWMLGDANDNWSADYYPSELRALDGDPEKHIELPVSSENKSNGRIIAVLFCASLIVDTLTPAQRAYAADAARGEFRGFAALHDFCDANMLLPGCETACDAGRFPDWLPFCNSVMDAVTARLVAEGGAK